MTALLLVLAAAGLVGAGGNHAAARWAPAVVARIVLFLCLAPMLGLLAWCAVEFALAVRTNDLRYFGADMALGIVVIATAIWVPSVLAGRWTGRRRRGPTAFH